MRQPDWQSPDGAVKLFYGDCLPLLAEMEAESVDCVVTDPPYGHNNNDNNDLIHRREAALGRLPCGETAPLESRPIANDGAEANEIFREALPLLFRALSPGCCCCCCCGGGGDGRRILQYAGGPAPRTPAGVAVRAVPSRQRGPGGEGRWEGAVQAAPPIDYRLP